MTRTIIGLALLVALGPASAQTIYRAQTTDGKTVYSDTAPATSGANRLVNVKVVSTEGADASADPVQPGNRPCQNDVQKFCRQAGGREQATECLLDHQQEISDACYAALEKRMKADNGNASGSGNARNRGGGGGDGGNAAPGEQACRQDALQFCRGVKPGQGRIVDCLLEHQDGLSDACYSSLEKRLKK